MRAGYPGSQQEPIITQILTHQERRNILAPFRSKLWKIAIRAVWFLLALTTIGGYRSGVDLTDRRFLIPALAIGITYGVMFIVPWETALYRPQGEAVMGLAAILLIVALAVMSTLSPIRPLVFVDYFAVISFTAALGGRFLHTIATVILIALNATMAFAFQNSVDIQELTVQSGTMIIVAIVLAAVASEFRQEAYVGYGREQELIARERQLEQLYEVSRTMAVGQRLSDVLPALVGKISTFLNAQVGVVLFYQPRDGALKVLSPIWTSGAELPVDDYTIELKQRTKLTTAFQLQTPTHISEVVESGLLEELGVSNAMAVPLTIDQQAIGLMIVADHADGSFSDGDLDTFVSLAAPAALILAQLDRYEAAAETSRQMEELARMKTDFVSVVSHELRTPLTSIIGSLDTLARPELASNHPSANGLLSSARAQSTRLRRLIEDLLTVSRIDNDALPQHPVTINLATFVAEAVAYIPGTDQAVKTTIGPNVNLHVDTDHLSRIIRNLVENALKYAPGTDILIGAEPTARGGIPHVELTVSDGGPGIPKDLRESAFGRFAQLADTTTRSQGGTGLGLWIVRSLVESMGGTVELTDAPERGATFVVTLPARSGVGVQAADQPT